MPIESRTPKSRIMGTLEISMARKARTAAIVAITNAGPSRAAVSAKGGVSIEAVVGRDVTLPAGEVTLIAVVGLADSLPPAESVRLTLGADGEGRGEGWVARAFALRVSERRSN